MVYQQHKTDEYQSHCLVVGLLFGSLAGIVNNGSVSEKSIRTFLPFGVVAALSCSMIGHAIVRRWAAEKESHASIMDTKEEKSPLES